jgi:monovalent cation:H+ antiporter-2, CPA2 family
MPHTFVADMATVLVVAAVISAVFRKLGQPAVLGYLLAGLLVGPYLPFPMFADPGRIHQLSEFGIVLVMFAVGLEFSVSRLFRVLPVSGFAGLFQISAMLAAGYGLAALLGFSTMEGIFLGGCVAISSTMIVAKVFADRPPPAAVRELVYGILVVQDLAAVVLVAALTAVATGSGVSTEALLSTLGSLAGVLVAMVVVGLLVVPRIVRFVADLGSPETLLVTTIALCFLLAGLAQHLGYSVALGAFLAGSLVAESGRTHHVEHLVHPVRDVFAAVFFVSIGMTVDPFVAFDYLGLAIGVAALVVIGQFSTISVAGVLSGNGLRRSITASLSLGQIGEFAFIIAAIGVSAGVVGEFLQPVVVTVAVTTAFTTPLLVRVAPRIATAVDRVLPRPIQTVVSLCESWFEAMRRTPAQSTDRPLLRNAAVVLIIDGSLIALVWVATYALHDDIGAWLREQLGIAPSAVRFVIVGIAVALSLPLVLATLRTAGRAGQLLARRVMPTRDGGVDTGEAPRRVFVVALQSMVVLAVGAPVVALTAPFVGPLWGLAALGVATLGLAAHFWRSATNLQGHVRAGAEALVALVQSQMASSESEPLPSASELLPGLGETRAVVVAPDAWACGRSLSELDLRARTGATVLAISRGERTMAMPAGQDIVEAGDTLLLAGGERAVVAATRVLERAASPERGDAPPR